MAAWTNKQVAALRAKYASAPREELERELAPHPWSSIAMTARRLGLRRRDPETTDYLSICARHVYQTSYFQRLCTR